MHTSAREKLPIFALSNHPLAATLMWHLLSRLSRTVCHVLIVTKVVLFRLKRWVLCGCSHLDSSHLANVTREFRIFYWVRRGLLGLVKSPILCTTDIAWFRFYSPSFCATTVCVSTEASLAQSPLRKASRTPLQFWAAILFPPRLVRAHAHTRTHTRTHSKGHVLTSRIVIHHALSDLLLIVFKDCKNCKQAFSSYQIVSQWDM